MAKRSSRRDFLKGRTAADAFVETIQGAVPTPNPLDFSTSEYEICIAREAMACEFEVRLNPRRFPQGTDVAIDALDIVTELDSRWSFFQEESEVSRINALAFEKPTPLSDDLCALLGLAKRVTEETEGAFDITSGPLADVWGFSGRRGRVPEESALDEARSLVGPDLLELNDEERTIGFRKRGVKINLGSIGKGWAIDRVGEYLEGEGIDTFLIHGGNSSVIARIGTVPGSAEGKLKRGPWEIGLASPLRKGVRIGTISLENTALATSGSAHQFFMHQGRRLGHVIDPRTGWPTDKVLSVTVVCPTAAEADALATAFFVLGPEAGEEFCRKRSDVGMVFVLPAVKGGDIDVRKIGPVALSALDSG